MLPSTSELQEPRAEQAPPIGIAGFADLPRWVRWREEQRTNKKGEVKKTKVPYRVDCELGAKANDPSTWSTRAAAEASLHQLPVAKGRLKGVGIVLGDLGAGRLLWGTDLDSCRDPASGDLEPWAATIVRALGSYTEISPSGTGVKVYGTCDSTLLPELKTWPNKVSRPRPSGGKDQAIEFYLERRYFAVTDQALKGFEMVRHLDRETLEVVRRAMHEFAPEEAKHKEKAGEKRQSNRGRHNRDLDLRLPAAEVALRIDPENADNRHGKELRVTCPCHDDDDPSLDLSNDTDGYLQATCRAGCIAADVYARLRELLGERRSGEAPEDGWNPTWQGNGQEEPPPPDDEPAPGPGPGPGPGPRPGPGGSAKLRKFKLTPVSDISYDPKSDHWLIDGLLATTGLATIWGKYKSYKSFIAFAVAVAIADANLKEWGGRALLHGTVIYVIAEDMGGIDARIEAYRRTMPGFDGLPLNIVKARPNLGVFPNDCKDLIEAICEALGNAAPVLIFLDTLARMVGAEGENDKGMQAFVNNAEAIAEAFGCLSVAIHHESAATDADPTADKPRGHTSLPCAVVSSWHVIKTSEGLEGPWTADVVVIGAKNSATGFTLKVTLKRVELGENRYDRMETILMLDTVQWADEPSAATAKKVRRQNKTLALLMTCFKFVRDGVGGSELRQVRGGNGPWIAVVDASKVREVFYERYPKPTKIEGEDDEEARKRDGDRKRKAFDRTLARVVEIELLFTETADDGRTFLWDA
jgi:hypothetical protein